MSDGEWAVEARGLTKHFGPIRAVDDVSFQIHRGECFGFLGPNGAGKTSAMRMVYCVSPPTAGSLKVFGWDVRRRAGAIKSLIGVIPQEENLDPDLSVFKNLTVYARYFGLKGREVEERIRELLAFMQLEERSESTIRELSGGMKRRLLIARALIHRPRMIILDEPTSGLDPQARHLIWQRLRLLKREGVTMLLTTHYMEEATQLCDRVIVMDKGKVLAEGNPSELVGAEVGREVVELRLEEAADGRVVEEVGAFAQSWERAGDTLYFFCEDGAQLVQALLNARKSHFLHRPATLEDVFLKLTGRELKE